MIYFAKYDPESSECQVKFPDQDDEKDTGDNLTNGQFYDFDNYTDSTGSSTESDFTYQERIQAIR